MLTRSTTLANMLMMMAAIALCVSVCAQPHLPRTHITSYFSDN
jgi:hypothetical protein